MSFTRSEPSGKALKRNASSAGRNSSWPVDTVAGFDLPSAASIPFVVRVEAEEDDGASVGSEAPWARSAPVPRNRASAASGIPKELCLYMIVFTGPCWGGSWANRRSASNEYRAHLAAPSLDRPAFLIVYRCRRSRGGVPQAVHCAGRFWALSVRCCAAKPKLIAAWLEFVRSVPIISSHAGRVLIKPCLALADFVLKHLNSF